MSSPSRQRPPKAAGHGGHHRRHGVEAFLASALVVCILALVYVLRPAPAYAPDIVEHAFTPATVRPLATASGRELPGAYALNVGMRAVRLLAVLNVRCLYTYVPHIHIPRFWDSLVHVDLLYGFISCKGVALYMTAHARASRR